MTIDRIIDPAAEASRRWTALVSCGVLAATIGYAVLRYTIVRGVPWENIPLFLANKSVALTATVLIGASYLTARRARLRPEAQGLIRYLPKHLGLSGFACAALHSVMSLALLSPVYYPNFFRPDGRMNLVGESAMLFGILALILFTGVAASSLAAIEQTMHPRHWRFVQRLGYLAYFLVLAHVVSMGWAGWWRPESWAYGLMSISLISALVVLLVLLMRALALAFRR